MAPEVAVSTPVLIVGAGPAGLALALTLLKNGVSVRVIDKTSTHHTGQRGAGIHPRTMEVYNFLGVLPDVLSASRPVSPIRVYKLPGGTEVVKEFRMVPRTDPTPAVPYVEFVVLGQDHAEGILRSHMEKYGCHVELGTELVSLEQHPEYVVARIAKTRDGKQVVEEVTCHWLVGTDGARGVVRNQIGLTFHGETRGVEQHMIVADFQLNGHFDRNFMHQWGEMSQKFIWMRPTTHGNNGWNLMGGGRGIDHAKIVADKAELIKFVHETTNRKDIDIGEVHWTSEYRPNIRMVNKFGEGRVFVAGDAAHVHSPMGAQGMNSSVQDSVNTILLFSLYPAYRDAFNQFNLGWKLALVEKGLSAPSLLSTYNEERLPVITEMLKKTTQLQDKMAIAKPHDESVWDRSGPIMQLGINYRWSSIVVDERAKTEDTPNQPLNAYGALSGDLHAGDRAPDAPGLHKIKGPDSFDETTSLFRVFGCSYHTVLIFTSDGEGLEAILGAVKQYPANALRIALVVPTDVAARPTADVDLMLLDQDGYAFTGYVSHDKTTVVIVRPDGVVGGILLSAEGVERYFGRIFGTSV
ncbi:hypothetical protein OBBRIDRAFT_807016 [Obba rivulosa]|uniref:FAD-binding domain-containing protein n=1 Tax=Obba rivulosa TaxID=1052685 RepID=A0A8E2AKY1_9APHY|nr:hypothetical protein OBBRIDRAFT_807016 [Obba rivulosa]